MAACCAAGWCAAAIAAEAAPRPPIADARLSAAGELTGRLVDAHGRAQTGVELRVGAPGGKPVATRTDARGEFRLAGLRPGVYLIAAPRGTSVVRAWNAAAAPPQARDGVLVVDSALTVNGQGGHGPGQGHWGPPGQGGHSGGFGHWMQNHTTGLCLAGLGVTAGTVAIVTAVNNDDDEAPASP